MNRKLENHKRFWEGEGPSLLLIPPDSGVLYDTTDYPRRFANPKLMWEAEIRRAEAVVEWPTDGIPTVRPNLGVTFIPAIAGLGYRLYDHSMPWPDAPLDRKNTLSAREVEVANTHMMGLAAEFYAIHRTSGHNKIAAYHPDTQGVFDIAHLLNGDRIFYELAEPENSQWIDDLLKSSLDIYVKVTAHIKHILEEPPHQMIHGHGTSQGVYFPGAGTRLSEDTAILLSPAMIDRFILPAVREAASSFGGAFVHFCGKHKALFERLCALDEVAAIDLGNPEMYDPHWLLQCCAKTNTVLYSRLAAEAGECWKAYTRRLAGLVRDTGARLILRPLVYPHNKLEALEMLGLWHGLTDVPKPVRIKELQKNAIGTELCAQGQSEAVHPHN